MPKRAISHMRAFCISSQMNIEEMNGLKSRQEEEMQQKGWSALDSKGL